MKKLALMVAVGAAALFLPAAAQAGTGKDTGTAARSQTEASTEWSSQRRYWRHRHVHRRVIYPRHRFVHRHWRWGPRPFVSAGFGPSWGWGYRPWRYRSAWYGPRYSYAYYPPRYYAPGPSISIGFGFGPRWGSPFFW